MSHDHEVFSMVIYLLLIQEGLLSVESDSNAVAFVAQRLIK